VTLEAEDSDSPCRLLKECHYDI